MGLSLWLVSLKTTDSMSLSIMRSDAKTVEEYLRSLPPEREKALRAVRRVILANLPMGYKEMMRYGMIGYAVPLEKYPRTYNGQPLAIAVLSSQKNYMAVYLMIVYSDKEIEAWFHKRYRASGKKLDMGKSCVRFRRLEDLPIDLIGEAIGRTSVKEYIEKYEKSRMR